MALKVINTIFELFIRNSINKMWKKIKWHKYNRFKKAKSKVALNNLHICIKLDKK